MHKRDPIAASSTPLVISILAEGDNYGYAIIQRVLDSSDRATNYLALYSLTRLNGELDLPSRFSSSRNALLVAGKES